MARFENRSVRRDRLKMPALHFPMWDLYISQNAPARVANFQAIHVDNYLGDVESVWLGGREREERDRKHTHMWVTRSDTMIK